MMPLSLFRNMTFAGVNALTFFYYAALSGAFFMLPFLLIDMKGAELERAELHSCRSTAKHQPFEFLEAGKVLKDEQRPERRRARIRDRRMLRQHPRQRIVLVCKPLQYHATQSAEEFVERQIGHAGKPDRQRVDEIADSSGESCRGTSLNRGADGDVVLVGQFVKQYEPESEQKHIIRDSCCPCVSTQRSSQLRIQFGPVRCP